MQKYIGSELEVFKLATNWKGHYSTNLFKFIKGDVLEVGAGIGGTTNILYDDNVKSWLSLEPDEEQLAVMSELEFIKGNAKIATALGTISDLDEEAKFDTILYIDVMEHIEDDRGEVIKIVHKLKKGGNLIVLSPAHQFLYSPFDKSVGHHRRYCAKSLTQIMPKELVCKKLFYLDSVGFFASLANKMVLKQSMPTLKQIKCWDKLMIPLSKILDNFLFHRFGKTVIGVWCLDEK